MAETTAYSTTAKRYAGAVFEIARDTGTGDAWREDLASIVELVEHPQAGPFLTSARVSDADKRRMVEGALQDISPVAMNLALLLLQRSRLHLAPLIAVEYNRMLDASRGIEHAIITTAVPLNEAGERAVAERLRDLTGAREMLVETRVDPSLIGGMVARIGDRLIDGSTRTKLVQLKRRLAEGSS